MHVLAAVSRRCPAPHVRRVVVVVVVVVAVVVVVVVVAATQQNPWLFLHGVLTVPTGQAHTPAADRTASAMHPRVTFVAWKEPFNDA